MDDKLKIILESINDVYKDKDSYRVVTIHDIVEKIAYNYEVKCYDIIYGIDIDELSTDEVIRICNINNITYSYMGEIKNSSQILLFERRDDYENIK